MKKLTMRIGTICIAAFLLIAASCTKLNEQVYGSKSIRDASNGSASDLKGVYSQIDGQTNQANTYALQEHPTDEMMGPTRGTDWGDFGTWRKLHTHTWDAFHNQVSDTWDELNTGVYRATQVINASGVSNQNKAEASFLRAYFMFQVVDLYGQAPFRDPAAASDVNPKVYSRSEATDFIIKDLEFAEANLGPTSDEGQASVSAADALLAKVYLNKAVYKAANVGGPFTFDAADMNKVIGYADKITAAGYHLNAHGKYFANFSWDNSTASTEIIFGLTNSATNAPANTHNRWRMTMHYNQTPSSWNGFTTLADFYNSFEDSDERKGVAYPGMTDLNGLRAGFLIGQQYGHGNVALKQRGGQPLVFTPVVSLNYSTEAQGIRVIKYLPKPAADGSVNDDYATNTYVLFRYSDVLLEKAEAIMRGGTPTGGQTALSIVNDLRVTRGASVLASVDATALLAERGRELYWEGWRRNDQIRFGTFNNPVDQRPAKTSPTRTIYPIPQRAVDSNPNLKQNAGY
ncbi:RagB/SusD family nutrient uptake outer membrane protein [Mucilaginibacter sp. BJC16-A38]|uniref:RagB/SusD family nutrient uptake outer membrane protein n=1 Tax=Mucilaginibacter phenanthrenivorans TaxID=1234842 RepID=UPI002158A042|nr:RagB/SusD family nutrient uptake outer membrane protein [Mucilaginibacter phenanthrenivorans]MCR8560254.1 RagB/SusD family nutrient uptake outer membrane protein [Mucilaginibacter phenanthrenivorans]